MEIPFMRHGRVQAGERGRGCQEQTKRQSAPGPPLVLRVFSRKRTRPGDQEARIPRRPNPCRQWCGSNRRLADRGVLNHGFAPRAVHPGPIRCSAVRPARGFRNHPFRKTRNAAQCASQPIVCYPLTPISCTSRSGDAPRSVYHPGVNAAPRPCVQALSNPSAAIPDGHAACAAMASSAHFARVFLAPLRRAAPPRAEAGSDRSPQKKRRPLARGVGCGLRPVQICAAFRYSGSGQRGCAGPS